MKPPFRPADDDHRVSTLRRYQVLDTRPEPALDDLIALAARVCDTPIALISVVDENRQWFKSRIGIDAPELPRSVSFCGHTILQPDLFIVPDAAEDERFFDNPLVTGDPLIRFYAGATLITADGHALGTICVIDRKPRELNPLQLETLRVLGRQVMAQLELHRQTREQAESEAKFSTAFHSSPVMLSIANAEGRLVEANPAFCRFAGRTRDEIVGQTFSELGFYAPPKSDAPTAPSLSGGATAEIEFTFQDRAGGVRHFLCTREAISLQGVAHELSTGVDITERKQAAEKLGIQTETLSAVTESLAYYLEQGDWREATGRLLRSAISQTQSEYGFVGVVVEGTLRVLAHEGIVWDKVLNRNFYEQALRSYEEKGYLEFTSFDNLFGRAITTGQVIISNLPATDSRAAGRPAGHPPMHSFLGVPIIAGQEVQGMVALANRPGGYSTEEKNRIQTLVRHVGGLCTSYRHHEAGLRLEEERRKAEAAQRESEKQLRLTVQAANVGLWDWNLDTNEVMFSREWKSQLGCEEHEIAHELSEWERRVHPDDLPKVLARVQGYLANPEGAYESEFRLRHKDGSWRWIYARGEAFRDNQGRRIRMLGCHVDITRRKQADESLRENEEKLRKVIDGLSPNIFVGLMTPDGTLIEANRAGLVAAGLKPEDVLGKPFDQTHWWSHSEPVREQLRGAMARAAAGEASRYDVQVRVTGDTLIWIDFSLHPVRDASGRVINLVPSANVIDERVKAQAAQRESLDRFEAVARATNDAVWDWDLTANTIWWNENFQIFFGYRPDEIEPGSESWTNRLHPSDRDRVLATVDAAIDSGKQIWSEEYRFRRADGSYVEIFDRGHILRNAEGRGLRMIGAMQDITARKKAALVLQESEERLRELAETIHEVFWITDPVRQQLLYVSTAFDKIWGYSCASLYAAPNLWIDSIHPDDRAGIQQAMETKQKRGDYDETYRIVRSDGAVRWIHDRAFPVYNAEGGVLRIVGTAEDITDRRQLEEQYRQSQKMEAIGQLAGGVAHDFNNILTAMVLQIELSRMADGVTAEIREGLQLIQACAERAANLTRQLLLFSHKQIMEPRDLDLNDVVTSLIKMLQRIIGEDMRLQLQLHPSALMTHADAGMLDQVLMNLAVNARDAMPSGGRLLIQTEEKIVDEETARLHPDAAPGRYVCLRVDDTGNGIAPEVLPRIFEPFFTTKQQGKGTGLGLATVFGIVQQHHGWMTVTSEVGRGTAFHVFLPAIDAPNRPSTPPLPVPVRGGTETILLAEDDPSVRLLTRIVLERAGYRVLEAADGVEARRQWKKHHATINLLFTDIVMPGGMSGHELAAQLQAQNPQLRVVFTSGYSAHLAGRELSLQKGQYFIQKPTPPARLLETVRQCLDS